MGTAIRRLGSSEQTTPASQRKASRLTARSVAQLSSLDGENVRVAIGEVSAHGCSIRCASGWLRAGRYVSIGLEEDAPLRAIVRWVREDTAGLEFLRPVPPESIEWRALMRAGY